MLVSKKNRLAVYSYLFKEGVIVAKKDPHLPKHPEVDVPNLHVMKLLTSLKSRAYVTEQFSWQYYYWYLTNEGIEYLREYLHLPTEIVPATLKKSNRPTTRPGADRFGGPRGPPRGDRFGGDRGDKKVGPAGDYKPEFRGRGGFGRGGDRDGFRGERPAGGRGRGQ
eukprot:GFYU01001186.1.p1 GENE.GFYU01001186.1~~GFYU01001186.1.p1  ORF type:complete len:180 (+),score=51.14 GFYU01001186.1:43-540(+)